MDRVELKMAAKQQIKGNIGMFFVCMLIAGAVGAALNLIPRVGGILNFIFMSPITLGFAIITLGLTHGEKVEVKKFFESFNDFGRALLLNVIVTVFVLLWSLLLIVPGIIKSLSYSMSFYILAENPDMTAMEALNESKRMMDGHKMDLFILELSFILWYLLGAITCGIAFIYVAPYQAVTIADYYNELKAKSDNVEIGSEE